VIARAGEKEGLIPGSISLIENTDRAGVRHLMTLNKYVDCLIPRGGASLIETVVKNATVPVIETGTGNCHIYIDASADPRMAESITLNAKTSRPSVCNAAETLLVHKAYAEKSEFLELLTALVESGVEIRGCPRTMEHADTIVLGIVRAKAALGRMLGLDTGLSVGVVEAFPMKPATEDDFYTEFNDMILAVKVVDTAEAAIEHIAKYGTRHSEAIITCDYDCARQFEDEVDAAAVYVNASTRFTDGFEFGFGAEIGISNQKLHARGPMGLEELTTIKYVVRGDGQVR
jgi:glutamate-5-semialdehyde dehydrogenase